ncbi:MAG TPA: alpha/beta hydrolase [Micromonospora sp.]|nr:alpha/beta hydrolase [Micromonospora sp.]
MTTTPTALPARTVRSADGTTISYHTTGTGPGLLVVPGALNDATDYSALADALAARFTVHTVNRRARDGSGPQGPDYSIATECADLTAVRAATGARYIFGHSYGGLVALEAARRDPGIDKLALYEPGVSVAGLIPMHWIPQYRQFLAQGRPFGAFVTFAIGTGPAAASRNPRWLMAAILRLVFRGERRAKIFRLLEANLHEHEEVGRLDDSYPNYREVSADVLLMAGGKSGLPYVASAFDRLAEVLPSARVHTFPKLDHFGPDQKGPAEVSETVTAFLLS